MNFEEYWSNQESSLHRSIDNVFEIKAKEHAFLLQQSDKSQGIIDWGCGAGEILFELYPLLKCELLALDFSEKLLNSAKEKNQKHPIKFELANALDYENYSFGSTWMTCSAVSQYFNLQEMKAFINKFSNNPVAKNLFLFDCIHPLKYALFTRKILESYTSDLNQQKIKTTHSLYQKLRNLKSNILLVYSLFRLIEKSKSQYCESLNEMGYAYRYDFWFNEIAQAFSLNVKIVSSLIYEYRYHVIISKK